MQLLIILAVIAVGLAMALAMTPVWIRQARAHAAHENRRGASMRFTIRPIRAQWNASALI